MKNNIIIAVVIAAFLAPSNVMAQGYVISKSDNTKIILAAKDVNNIKAVANPVATDLDYYTKLQLDSIAKANLDSIYEVKEVAKKQIYDLYDSMGSLKEDIDYETKSRIYTDQDLAVQIVELQKTIEDLAARVADLTKRVATLEAKQ